MRSQIKSTIFLILIFAQIAFPQDRVDEQMIARIKTEGFQNSRIMETLGYLTDVFGPRLTGSLNNSKAQVWARDTLTSWGMQNAALDPWGTIGTGWAVERFSAEMLAPTYDRLNVYPLAWSPGTNGVISGTPVVASIRSKADFDKYRGKLKNAILFRVRLPAENPDSRSAPQSKRFSTDELAAAKAEINPSANGINGGSTTTFADEEESWQTGLAAQHEIIKFLKDEGVAALIEPSRRPNGVLAVQGYYAFDPAKNIPAFTMAREQYARIVRLVDRNIPVKIELNLAVKTQQNPPGYNVIAEIPGSDPQLKDEVVMVGGHFDSWHSGTGAVDNGAGCVVMMEAMRILKAVGARPRRTIRIALWDGEEQSYFGSVAYVKKHFGDPMTQTILPGSEKLSAYYNLDNGSGKIRGIFLQGNEAARPVFEAYLRPFAYLNADTVSVLNTGGTDHMAFDALGLPGFQFIQDPLDYETRIHHTNLDVLEAPNENDLKSNAVIIASIVYHTAMRDAKIPREPAPHPAVGTGR